MFKSREHFQHRPGDFVLSLNRLIRIRIGTHGHGPARILGHAQRFFQQRGRFGFGEKLALEVEAGRKPQIGMCRSGEAVTASVFAASVRVYGAIKGYVRRRIPGNNCTAAVPKDLGSQLGWG